MGWLTAKDLEAIIRTPFHAEWGKPGRGWKWQEGAEFWAGADVELTEGMLVDCMWNGEQKSSQEALRGLAQAPGRTELPVIEVG